jgi:hypothetical protein
MRASPECLDAPMLAPAGPPALNERASGDRIVEGLSELGRALLTSLDFEESKPNKQAIGNGAPGPRARLILAGLVLEGAWFMNVMPSARRMLWHAIGGRWYVRYSRSIRRDIR